MSEMTVKRAQSKRNAANWEKRKSKSARYRDKISRLGRDIAPLPGIVNRRRRRRALANFKLFCETYFPKTFTLEWSSDQLDVLAKMERCVKEGGQFAMAMHRGSGKTSICEIAAIWALFTGMRDFVVLIGADAGHARNMLESVKVELETNDLLLDDFPEVVYAIRKLEGIYQRTSGQLYDGKSTWMEFTADSLVLPTIRRSKASGGVVKVAGLEARIRGMKFKRPDGRSVRPSLVILDDPQTDESARSVQQTQVRMSILNGAILNLGGPGKKISAVLPCTVIQRGDLADQILDSQKHPDWQGVRTKLVYSFPTNTKMWDKYREMRATDLRAGGNGAVATHFYEQHREKMDEGSKVSWKEFYNRSDEISAVQHAMNLLFRDEKSFYSEYQNDPLPDETAAEGAVTEADIAKKINNLKRAVVSPRCTQLTAFVDVQAKVLFWMVCAWEQDFTGYIVDYGTYPDQKSRDFILPNLQYTLGDTHPGTGLEGTIFAGLNACVKSLLEKQWLITDGPVLRLSRCLIDAGWGQSTDVVYRFVEQSVQASVVLPSHGHYVGASSLPMSEYQKKPGDQIGLNWRIPGKSQRRRGRYVIFDSNFWKSFVAARWRVASGDPGGLSLFGRSIDHHSLLVRHFMSEYPVRTEGRGRQVDEWKLKVRGSDNHWWDCLIGCAVGAATLGVSLFDSAKPRTSTVRVKLSELRARRLADAKSVVDTEHHPVTHN